MNTESLTIDNKVISSEEESKIGLQELIDYEYYRNQITSTYFQNIKNHIENFSNFGSRVTGYPGYENAISYIKDFFKSQNLTDIQTLSYPLLIPMDHETKIAINGENYSAHALVPNSVHTCKTPSSGLSGTLIYGGSGEYIDLDGKKIEGSIVVLEFDSQDNWINVVSLGAKAVIYLKPNDSNRYEAETKSIDVPLGFPRIYINNRTTAVNLRKLSYQLNQSITIYSDVEWTSINAKNIMGLLPGLDDDIIIISAYFDSSSIIPTVSPGADEACGIATLLEIIRVMKDNNVVPQKTLMFLALSGHNQAASGAREFVYQNYERLNKKGGIKLFLSLDLSASTRKIGINPYGYLYKFKLKYTIGNNLYRRLKSIGEEFFQQYAADIQLVDNHSFSVESYINMQDQFEHIAPITFVGDQEPFVTSNVLGLSLYSADSDRLRFNTPFDLPKYLQLEELKSQVIYSICALVQLVNDDRLENYLDLQQKEFSVKPTTHVGYGFIKGSCKEYNETTLWVNNVANAIIRIKSCDPNTRNLGIYSYYTKTDENGAFQVRGISSSQPDNPLEFEVEAYFFDSEGKLMKTNNLGSYGVFFEQSKKLMTKEITINPTIFNCGTLGLFEISHPYDQDISDQSLTYQVLNPETRTSLPFYGYRNHESVSLIFLPPHTRANIIGTFTDKILGVYATNSSAVTLQENGFQVHKSEFKNLGITTFITSKDLQSKTQTYINWYTTHNIYDEEVTNTFQRVSGQISYANQLKENYQYSKARIEIKNARILVDTALKQARNIIEDGTMTALLFAFFLIPFSVILTW
ncbi:MAG: M28 family peptidase, partial [Candidatus Hodarchaeales archaeon]